MFNPQVLLPEYSLFLSLQFSEGPDSPIKSDRFPPVPKCSPSTSQFGFISGNAIKGTYSSFQMLYLVFLNRFPLVPLDSYCDCSRDNDLCHGQLEGKFGPSAFLINSQFPDRNPFYMGTVKAVVGICQRPSVLM
jgi:hypothetical protein